ncbi:hypothetical protein DRQ07_11395 [candidate division KSB1 bacterium]|nr:MAG: hypothetical protein DRQ07_11395 [candidate division KSB1 bacterium]
MPGGFIIRTCPAIKKEGLLLSKAVTKIQIIFTVFLLIYPVKAQKFMVTLTKVMNIGEGENIKKECVFKFPLFVITDSKKNIYVSDYGQSRIKVFDKNGSFVKYIGKTGRGPGEFQEISAVSIDSKDNLVIVDKKNWRITTYSDFGDNYKCSPFNDKLSLLLIKHLNDSQTIFFYVKSAPGFYKKTDKLFHIYNEKFKEMSSFGQMKTVYNFDDDFIIERIRHEVFASIEVVNQNKFFFSPEYYYGDIYMFERKADNWEITKIKGKSFYKKPYKEININNTNLKHYSFVYSGVKKKYGIKLLCKNEGLVTLNDTTLMHLLFRVSGKDKVLRYIELFKTSGEFLGYADNGDIEMIPPEPGLKGLEKVFCRDNEGNVYLSICTKEGFYTVGKYKVSYRRL